MKRCTSFERYSIFGIPVCDATCAEAIAVIEDGIAGGRAETTTIYFVNANILNLASSDSAYAQVLRRADFVFGDGTGVRWASRILRGIEPRDNVNGTDLIPMMFRGLAGRGHRYYLLGARPDEMVRAGDFARETFDGWKCVGTHHGYVRDFSDAESESLLCGIRESGADLLLIGMGNPLQEEWVDEHRATLGVGVAIAVGGLFAYWSDDLDRAPGWMQRLGVEWLHLMLRQPRKVPRYLLGNPAFLLRVIYERLRAGRTRAIRDARNNCP